MRPGKRRALDKNSAWGALLDKAEQLKASVRAKVEHPFRVLKCQFGFTKVRYKGVEIGVKLLHKWVKTEIDFHQRSFADEQPLKRAVFRPSFTLRRSTTKGSTGGSGWGF